MENESKLSQSLPEPVILSIADDDDSGDDNVFLRKHRNAVEPSRNQHSGGFRSSYKRAIHTFDDQPSSSREDIDDEQLLNQNPPIRNDSNLGVRPTAANGDFYGYRSSYKKALNTFETTPHGSTKLSSNSLQQQKKKSTENNELTNVRPLR